MSSSALKFFTDQNKREWWGQFFIEKEDNKFIFKEHAFYCEFSRVPEGKYYSCKLRRNVYLPEYFITTYLISASKDPFVIESSPKPLNLVCTFADQEYFMFASFTGFPTLVMWEKWYKLYIMKNLNAKKLIAKNKFKEVLAEESCVYSKGLKVFCKHSLDGDENFRMVVVYPWDEKTCLLKPFLKKKL